MPGGLIEISTYGSQDLFLTGTPEITFFKVIYRRHTPFSMETIAVNFDDPVGFGMCSTVKIPKVGDLMHKTYLEVILPEINLKRNNIDTDKIQKYGTKFDTAKKNLDVLRSFLKINRLAYVNAYDKYIAENNSNALYDMIQSIRNVFTNPLNESTINSAKLLFLNETVPYSYNEIAMYSIVLDINVATSTDILLKELTFGIKKSIKMQKYFYKCMSKYKKKLEDARHCNIKFAWVDRIGHAIINSVEVKIGGQKIDRHYCNWLNIWYELSANRSMEKIYFEMIGNVPELTSFDRNIKSKYIIRVPLQFWFCRFSGLSIPLVALEYHDVSLHFEFKKFHELCYIEKCETIKYSGSDDGIYLDEVPNEMNINIDAKLLIDYIYLDGVERKRFAQSSHEYLIDQLQILEKNNITQNNLQLNIDNFVHPSKELIWIAQKNAYTQNECGYNKCMWDNYSASDKNELNPIAFSNLNFHGYDRILKLDGNYFNYVQPYETHQTTPSDGINMYSFSLFPEEFQPSGSANLSKLDRITLSMQFSENIKNDVLNVKVYTRNLNILRFASGFAGMAFVYG